MIRYPYVVVVFVCFLFSVATGHALPEGPVVRHGTAAFSHPDPATLTISNSPRAIINWQQFSILQKEHTRFLQQSAQSAVLNRVVGPDASQILGQLWSNGRVFLINPHGMVIGPDAVIDTNGFVAATLNITDADFIAGRLRFAGDASSGAIDNQGFITAGKDGDVLLLAPNIVNSGAIRTEGGDLLLAAGEAVTITSLDLKGVHFEVQAPDNAVVNLGKLLADGGVAGIFAGTIRQNGAVSADSVGTDAAGNVVFMAAGSIRQTGSVSADGPSGGRVVMESRAGVTDVSGRVSARGAKEGGGEIRILGRSVALTGAAVIDASGETGGGRVLVGGDVQGKNPAVANATSTDVGRDVVISADAGCVGDGGEVIVWSDGTTGFHGTVRARGGETGGNGGFAEVSGKKTLAFNGYVNLTAPRGRAGTLLLDPENATVADTGGDDEANPPEVEAPIPAEPAAPDGEADADAQALEQGDTDSTTPAASKDPDDTVDTEAPVVDTEAVEAILEDGTNITFQAENAVTIGDAVSVSGGGDLSILAGGHVSINATVSLAGGRFASRGVNFTNTAAITTGGGGVTLDHSGNVKIAATIDTGGGAFSSSGAAFDSGPGRILAGHTTLDHSGAVTLGATTVSGSLQVTAGGDITQAGALTVAGAADFTAGRAGVVPPGTEDVPEIDGFGTVLEAATAESAGPPADGLEAAVLAGGDIYLDVVDNLLAGPVRFETAGPDDHVRVYTASDLDLGASAVGGRLTAEAGGNLGVSGAVAAGGVDLTADGDLALDASVTAVSEDVDIQAGGDLDARADITAHGESGGIRLDAGDALSLDETATVSAAGTVEIAGRRIVSAGTVRGTPGMDDVPARVSITADKNLTVTETGVVEALSNGSQPSVIRLAAGEGGVLTVAGKVDASGAAGGVNDGGDVRIIAEDTLDLQSTAAVRVDGGPDGGHGGFLELSGKRQIALNGNFTGRSQMEGYRNGSLFIDPTDINIVSGGIDLLPGSTVNAGDPPATMNLDPVNLSGWGDVTLEATHDISILTAIADGDLDIGASLTLTAGNEVNINADIGAIGDRFEHALVISADSHINLNAGIYIDYVNPVFNLEDIKLSAGDAVNIAATGRIDLSSADGSANLLVEAKNDGGALTMAPGSNITYAGGATPGIQIILKADDMDLQGTVVDPGAGVRIANATAGREIDMGTNTPGKLGLTSAELNTITAADLRIRPYLAPCGEVSVTAPVNVTSSGQLLVILDTFGSGGLVVGPGGSLAANYLSLTVKDIDVQGAVQGSTVNIYPLFSATDPVELGTSGYDMGVFALDQAELDRLDVSSVLTFGRL